MGVTHANTALRRIPVLWGTRAVGHPLLHGRAPLGVHGCSHGACDPNESPLKAWRKADAISSLDETGGQALVCALSRGTAGSLVIRSRCLVTDGAGWGGGRSETSRGRRRCGTHSGGDGYLRVWVMVGLGWEPPGAVGCLARRRESQEAKSSPGDVESSLGDAKNSLGGAKSSAGWVQMRTGPC